LSSYEFGKLEVNAEKSIRETDEEIVVPAILERESILQYDDGMGYRSAEEFKKAAWLLNGTSIILYRHAWPIWNFRQDDVKGQVWDVTWEDERAALLGDLHFRKAACDAELLEKIRSGGLSKDTSTAYRYMHDNTPGVFGGQPFDYQQRGFVFAHIAVGVPEGRCPGPYLGMLENSSDFLHVSLKPQGLFRSIATVMVSAKEGVYAVVGKLRDGSKETVTSEFVFDRELGWTDEKAEAYVKVHKNSVGVNDMSVEEIAAKIVELQKQRDVLQGKVDAIYSKMGKEEQKLQKEIDVLYAKMPRESYSPDLQELYGQLEDVRAEIKGFQDKKIELTVAGAADNLVAGSSVNASVTTVPKLDPYEVLAKSRWLLGLR